MKKMMLLCMMFFFIVGCSSQDAPTTSVRVLSLSYVTTENIMTSLTSHTIFDSTNIDTNQDFIFPGDTLLFTIELYDPDYEFVSLMYVTMNDQQYRANTTDTIIATRDQGDTIYIDVPLVVNKEALTFTIDEVHFAKVDSEGDFSAIIDDRSETTVTIDVYQEDESPYIEDNIAFLNDHVSQWLEIFGPMIESDGAVRNPLTEVMINPIFSFYGIRGIDLSFTCNFDFQIAYQVLDYHTMESLQMTSLVQSSIHEDHPFFQIGYPEKGLVESISFFHVGNEIWATIHNQDVCVGTSNMRMNLYYDATFDWNYWGDTDYIDTVLNPFIELNIPHLNGKIHELSGFTDGQEILESTFLAAQSSRIIHVTVPYGATPNRLDYDMFTWKDENQVDHQVPQYLEIKESTVYLYVYETELLNDLNLVFHRIGNAIYLSVDTYDLLIGWMGPETVLGATGLGLLDG